MSLAQLRTTLARLAEIPKPAVTAASKAVEEIARAEGGSVVLGRKKRRVKLRAITRIKPSGDSITASVYGVPTGPWVFKSYGASPHAIPRRPPTPRRPRPMKGDGYEHPVSNKQLHHPGSSGDGGWRRVRERAAVEVPRVIRAEVKRALSR